MTTTPPADAFVLKRIIAAVKRYQEAPFRSADYTVGEIVTVLDTMPANDAAAPPQAIERSAGEGMKPWEGGDDAGPDDWDGGRVLHREGLMAEAVRWFHASDKDHREGRWLKDFDIIAYTPRAALASRSTTEKSAGEAPLPWPPSESFLNEGLAQIVAAFWSVSTANYIRSGRLRPEDIKAKYALREVVRPYAERAFALASLSTMVGREAIAQIVHGCLSRANIDAYLAMPSDTPGVVADAILALIATPVIEGEGK